MIIVFSKVASQVSRNIIVHVIKTHECPTESDLNDWELPDGKNNRLIRQNAYITISHAEILLVP